MDAREIADIGIDFRAIDNSFMAMPRFALDLTGPHQALEALRSATAELRAAGDARAAFPEVYAVITARVVDRLATGYFLRPDFIARLDVRFAVRYLETLNWSADGSPQDCAGWSIAYDHVGRPGVPPLQHAALGISAHINFDLALGIAAVIEELAPDGDPVTMAEFKHDHDAVNLLLAESLPEALSLLTEGHGCPVTPLLPPLAGRAMLGVLAQWRALVWHNVLRLRTAGAGPQREAEIRRIDASARAIAQTLSQPALLALAFRGLRMSAQPALRASAIPAAACRTSAEG